MYLLIGSRQNNSSLGGAKIKALNGIFVLWLCLVSGRKKIDLPN
jgi:hypothetical protein